MVVTSLLLGGLVMPMNRIIPHLPENPEFLPQNGDGAKRSTGTRGRKLVDLSPAYIIVLLLFPLGGQIPIEQMMPPNGMMIRD